MTPHHSMLRQPSHLLSLSFGAGLAKWAPGTAGSLVALPIHWSLHTQTLSAQLFVVFCGSIIGIYATSVTTEFLGKQDHQAIVWDETMGALLVLVFMPASWLWWAAAIVTFRFFDIVKPWPIRMIDHYTDAGFAIMADDVAAAAMSLVSLKFAQLLITQWQISTVVAP